MDNHDNDILETIGGLDKNLLNNILNNKYSPSTDMAESEDLSSSLKHSSYYDTKSFTNLLIQPVFGQNLTKLIFFLTFSLPYMTEISVVIRQ